MRVVPNKDIDAREVKEYLPGPMDVATNSSFNFRAAYSNSDSQKRTRRFRNLEEADARRGRICVKIPNPRTIARVPCVWTRRCLCMRADIEVYRGTWRIATPAAYPTSGYLRCPMNRASQIGLAYE